MKDMKGKAKFSDLNGYDLYDKEGIFDVDSDVFIPDAIGDVINDKTASKLLEHNVKMVVEGANLPTLPSAGEYLHKNGIWIIPDFIANAGGVIGSFVEYQGRTEKEAFELIKYKIVKGYKKHTYGSRYKTRESWNFGNRNVKTGYLSSHVAEKVAINVAREAFERHDKISV
jgi:glutamate dehydrogenase (NAD(P)+)